jgi:DNA invertase Pin-like site-specific DNA recombinase
MFDAHIICRFSSQDKEDASIERQKAQCLEVAAKLGCDPDKIKVMANDNLSGASPLDQRVDLLELEKDIKAGLCKKLIVYRFDRLARDFEVSGRLLNLLKFNNIQLYDESGELDYSTAAGQAFFGMKSVFASFERAMITERMYAGKRYHFKQGRNWGGPLPLGIKVDGKRLRPMGQY